MSIPAILSEERRIRYEEHHQKIDEMKEDIPSNLAHELTVTPWFVLLPQILLKSLIDVL